MKCNQIFRKLCLLVGALVTLFSYSHADTIVSVTDALNLNNRAGAFIGGPFRNVVAASWTQSGGYFKNVTIDAELVSTDASFLSGTAYLMSAIGPGTTSASEVVAPLGFTAQLGPVGNPGPSLPPTVLFSGLTLGPGTYYLVLTAPFQAGTTGSPLTWQIPTNPVFTTASFATIGLAFTSITPNAFPPASDFTFTNPLMFDVTGTKVVPEPSSLFLLSTGLLGIAGAVRAKLLR